MNFFKIWTAIDFTFPDKQTAVSQVGDKTRFAVVFSKTMALPFFLRRRVMPPLRMGRQHTVRVVKREMESEREKETKKMGAKRGEPCTRRSGCPLGGKVNRGGHVQRQEN